MQPAPFAIWMHQYLPMVELSWLWRMGQSVAIGEVIVGCACFVEVLRKQAVLVGLLLALAFVVATCVSLATGSQAACGCLGDLVVSSYFRLALSGALLLLFLTANCLAKSSNQAAI